MAFAFNNSGWVNGSFSTDDYAIPYTAGSNSKLVVLTISGFDSGISTRGDDPPTYDGNNMSQVDTGYASAEGWTEMWYYLSPTASEKNIIVPNTNTYNIRYSVSDYTNASADASYFGGAGLSDGDAADVACTVASVPDGSVCVSCMVHGEKDEFASISVGTTLLENPPGTPVPSFDEGSTQTGAAYSIQSGTGDETHTYVSGGSSDDYNWVMGAWQEAVANINVNQYDDGLSVSDEVDVYINPYPLVNIADENPEVSDESGQYITPYLISQYDDSLEVTDESLQYINPYPLVSAADENPTVEDYANVLLNYAITVDDDISVQDETDQYLSLYEINVYDELSLEDDGIGGIASTLEISVYDLVFIHPAYRRPNVADDITIEDEASHYLTIYEVNVHDDVTIEDYDNAKVNLSISVYDDVSVADESLQHATPYLIYVFDSVTVEDEAGQSLTLYEIYASEDIEVEDYSALELSYYEIYTYDDLTIEDYAEPVVTAPNLVYINEYDSLTVQDERDFQVKQYLVYAHDDLAVEDDSSLYLTIYEVYQYDGLTVGDEKELTIGGFLTISVFDDVTVEDESDAALDLFVIYENDGLTIGDYSNQYLNLYEISQYDSLELQDETSTSLSLFEINVADELTVSDEYNAYISPYLISEYEAITAGDYSNQSVEYPAKQVEVYDSVSLEDYANVAFAIYPFLQGYLTIQATRSKLSVSHTMSEFEVSETDSELSVTR